MDEYTSNISCSEVNSNKNVALHSKEQNTSLSEIIRNPKNLDNTAIPEEQVFTKQSSDVEVVNNYKSSAGPGIELGTAEVPILNDVPKCNIGSMANNSNSNFEACVSKEKFELQDMSQVDLLVDRKSIDLHSIYPESFKRRKLELYGEVTGPCLYNVDTYAASKPLIVKNLPAAFEGLPLEGRPKSIDTMKDFQDKKLKEFVGSEFTDSDFEKLAKYCSADHLKTGSEVIMPSKIPALGLCPPVQNVEPRDGATGELYINKKYRKREDTDDVRCLKYRGVRVIEPPKESDMLSDSEELLEPGKDLIYRVRVYRPFPSTAYKSTRVRHSLCQNDVVLCGRQPLWALRDRIVCANDVDMRVDVSDNPDAQPTSTAKEVFPSGYLFINNVVHVDRRAGRRDLTAGLRAWARARRLGDFPLADMDCALHDLTLRLGHPEVYVHQGNCEHIFTFSSVRVATALDPLRLSSYPYVTLITSNQTVYCTTCAEFGAKWIVTGSNRVPFDPAFFCETCLKLYMYKDGKKIGDFKAFSYKGNEINLLKPLTE